MVCWHICSWWPITQNWVLIQDYMANRKKRVNFLVIVFQGRLSGHAPQRSSPQGFDGWHQNHGVMGYYFTLHWINGSAGSYLSPAFLFLSFSFFPSLSLSSMPSSNWIEEKKKSVQSADFTFQITLLSEFFVSFVVEVDVECESMVDNDQPVWSWHVISY